MQNKPGIQRVVQMVLSGNRRRIRISKSTKHGKTVLQDTFIEDASRSWRRDRLIARETQPHASQHLAAVRTGVESLTQAYFQEGDEQ